MKRFTAALLALLLAMSLAGCGLSRKKAESSTESKESQEKVENSNLKAGFLFSGDSEATSTIARKNDIEKMQGQQVNLKLWVKVKKDWRDSDILIKNFGYKEDER